MTSNKRNKISVRIDFYSDREITKNDIYSAFAQDEFYWTELKKILKVTKDDLVSLTVLPKKNL